MSELVVVGFDDPFEADRVLTELVRLEKEYLIDLDDAAIVTRSPDGRVKVKQTMHMAGMGAASGGAWGALWGTLLGALFFVPLIGLAAGAIVGAGTGALSGSLTDYGIDDDFIKSVGDTLKPDTSALFLLIRKAQPEKVLKELSRFKGRIIRSSLSPEQETKLEAALSQAARQQQPATA